MIAVGIYCVARSVSSISPSDILVAGSAQAFGYVAALVTLVAPAGLGIRDAAFAWAFKVAAPGNSFAVASLIAIAVRGVLTVVEMLYVGIVTALGAARGVVDSHRRDASSPEAAEEEEASLPDKSRADSATTSIRRRGSSAHDATGDAGSELVGGQPEDQKLEQAVSREGC